MCEAFSQSISYRSTVVT